MRKWNKILISSLMAGALALPAALVAQATDPAAPHPAAQDGDNATTITAPAPGDQQVIFRDANGNLVLARAALEARLQQVAGQAAAAGDQAAAVADQAKAEIERAMALNAANGMWVARGGKKEKAAYIGVVAVQADPALRAQLKLPRGIGLVLQQVQDDSPGATAGLQEHDLITKLDDQWLVTSQQLGVLVRMHKAGEQITLTGLRAGEPLTLKVTLGEKEMVINDQGEQLGAAQGWNLNVPVPALQGFQGLVLDGDDAALVIRENDKTLKISMKDNERHLVATDGNEQVLFDGAVETDEQRKSLPADLAELLEKYKDQFEQVKENGPGNVHRIRIINKDK